MEISSAPDWTVDLFDLFDLVEGVYLRRYEFNQHEALLVFLNWSRGGPCCAGVNAPGGQ